MDALGMIHRDGGKFAMASYGEPRRSGVDAEKTVSGISSTNSGPRSNHARVATRGETR